MHSTPTARHLGVAKTYEQTSHHFYWPKMAKEVKKFVTSCDECQRNKSSNQQPAGLLQPLEIPAERWAQVTMDFIVQLPTTQNGHDAIVVFVDHYTKRAHFHPTHTTVTAPEVAKIFFDVIFKHYGLPKAIISDQDTCFTSHFWKALFEQLGTKLSMFTAFHSQTDGQTERMNHTLEEMLRIHVTYKQDQWDEYLPAAEFAYNNSKQASTGFTPFELDTSHHPITLAASIIPTKIPAANEYVEHWNFIMKAAREALEQARKRQKRYANQHRRHIEFSVGDKILLSARNINTPVD